MARVELMPGIESISGSVGGLIFRTRNGKTFMYRKADPVLPEHPTRKQKAEHKKRVVVEACISLIQSQMDDMLKAIQQRKKIYDRVCYLYKKLSPEIKARTKLQKAIMTAYWQGENGPRMDRENLENGPMK